MQSLSLKLEDFEKLSQIVLDCYCPERVIKPNGEERLGFFNLKRLYGTPQAFQKVIAILSNFVKSEAICAADIGIAPFVGALALAQQIPSIYVRPTPKYYYLSYGSTQDQNKPQLFGEFLKEGTEVLIFDDVINTGETIVNAITKLRDAGLVVKSVLCIMNVQKDQSAIERVRNCGIENITVLLDASKVIEGWKKDKKNA